RFSRDWSSDVCSSDLKLPAQLRADKRLDPGRLTDAIEHLDDALFLLKRAQKVAQTVDILRDLGEFEDVDGTLDVQLRLRRMVEQIGRASCRERVEVSE